MPVDYRLIHNLQEDKIRIKGLEKGLGEEFIFLSLAPSILISSLFNCNRWNSLRILLLWYLCICCRLKLISGCFDLT